MALRELARKGAGLVARVDSQPALQTFARAMTAKVNQVTGAPMELYDKRKVRTPASLPSSRRGKPYFQPSARPDSARRGLDGVARDRRRRTSVDAVVVGVVAVFGVGVGAFAAVLLSLDHHLQTAETSHRRHPPVLHQVVIFRPARAACQQGKALLNTWKIHPGEQQKWENPLMGWTSTGDAMAHQFNSILSFDSKEAAVAFCEKHGWTFEAQEPQLMGKGASTIPGAGKAGVRPKSYGDNFAVARKGIPVWPHPGFGGASQRAKK